MNHGHVWKIDEYGDVDLFAYYLGDYHNGPLCVNCGFGFCHHCTKEANVPKCREVLQ